MFDEMRESENMNLKTKTLRVSRIPPDVDEEDLKVLFSSYGNVVRVYCGFSKDVSNLRYGFVEFSAVREAECALEELDGEPPYYFSIEFAKYTKPKKERQNFKMSGASSIRVTTCGNRREVILYDQYSESDMYKCNENSFDCSEDYRVTRENFSDDIIASKAHMNNNFCDMTDDDLLPIPAPCFRSDKRAFDCAYAHCHNYSHGFCSHCCHMYSSSDISAKQRQHSMYQRSCFISNQMLGVEGKRYKQRSNYQKETLQNKNIPSFSEKNSQPIHPFGFDYHSRKHSEDKLHFSYEEKMKTAAESYRVGTLLQKGKGNENVFQIPKNLKKHQHEQRKMPHNMEIKKQNISSANRENAGQKQFKAYYQENQSHKNKEKYNERNSNINNRNQNQMGKDHFRKKQVNEDSGHNRRKENEANQKKANFQKQDLDFKEGIASESVRSLSQRENKSNNLKINNKEFQDLKINTEIPIYLCYGNNPDELWIHKLPETATNLEELSKELQIYCEQSEVYSPEVGEICGGLFSVDNTWYRARIEGVDDKGLCNAYFVDYGNSEILSKYHIRQLKSDFLKLPFQAIPCKLVGIKPAGNNWSDDAIKMILFTTYLKAKIIRKWENKYEIDLINGKEESMSDLLIKCNYAKPVNDVAVNNLSENLDECMILCNKESVSEIKNLSGKTKHKFGISSIIEKLPLDLRFKATVVFRSRNGRDFWIHPIVIGVRENLKKLTVLNDYGNNYIEKYRPKVNEVIVAQSPADEFWYRAFVISKNNDEYFVYYLDYGNKEHVKNVAPLLPEYEKLPSCIIHCFPKDSCSEKLYTESIIGDVCLSGKLLSVNEDRVDIEFMFENGSIYVSGYPWYYDLKIDNVNICNSSNVDIRQSFDTISKVVNNEGSEVVIPSGIEVFKPGITLKLQIIYNVTNKDFWVQPLTIEARDVLNKLEQLNEQANKCDDNNTIKLDKIVIAQSAEDGCWYRAYVTGRSSSGYHVRFVDYGNEEVVTKILPISLDDSLLPSYAFHCIITQQLSEEEESIFNECFASQLLDVNVIFCDDDTIHMDFVISENCCISLFGYPWYHNLKANKSLNEPSDSMIVNDDLNEKNEYSLKEIQGFNKIPSAIETVKVGSELHLIVSVCFGDVFSALISEVNLFENIANLEQCLKLENSCSSQSEFKIGDLVTALSPTDNFLYRACILKSFTDSFLVCFVDYGKHEVVKNIGYLEEKFCSLPSPAIYCNMNAVSAEVKNHLKKLILPNEEIIAILKAKIDDNIYLELFDSNSNENICQINVFPWNYGLYENLSHSPELIFTIDDHPKVNADEQKIGNSTESSKTEDEMIEYTKTENIKNSDCENAVLQTVTPSKRYNEQTLAKTAVITTANNIEVREKYIMEKVPSILKTLLPGKQVYINIVVTFPDKLDFWAIIFDQDVFSSLTEIESSLKIIQSNNNFNPDIGDIIAAESVADQAWYRACVLDKNEDHVKVRYVDYGNEEYVTTYKPIHDEQLSMISPVMYCMIQDSKFIDKDKLKQLLVVSQTLLVKINQQNSEEAYLTLLNEESEPICDIKALPWYHNLTFLKPYSTAISYENSLMVDTSSDHTNDSLQIPAIKMHEDMEKLILSDFDNFEVKVVSVESYEKLFVQPIKFEEEITELINEVTQYCEKLPNKSYDPKINEMVCAKFSEDNLWYRGWVIKSLSSLNYLIQFVDFGNEESVESNCLTPLPVEFANKPIYSIPVTVHSLPSLSDISELCQQLWKMKIVNSQDNIIQLLNLDDSNNEQLNTKKSNAKTEICGNSGKDTEIFMYNNCKFVNLPLGTVEMIITSIISPETIFCNLVDITNMSVLKKLNDDVNLYCSNNAFENYHPECGEICLAKYSVDNMWYRAVPLKIIDEKLQLLFVDYGNIEIVKYEDTRRMTSEFMKVPVQAVHCKLSGLVEQTWTVDVIDELLKILPQQCSITAQVLDKVILSDMFIYVIDIPSAREHLLKTGLVKPQAED